MQTTSRPAISEDIDIAALLRALNRRWGWIFGFAAIAAAATYVALSFVTPLYSSQARILIEREENFYKRPADSQSQNGQRAESDQEAVSSQVQVLQSRDLALGVVKALRLDEDPEFNKEAGSGVLWRKAMRFLRLERQPTEQALQERVLDAFLDRLSVYQLQGSRVIAAEFQSRSPETAARAANKLAELYLTWQQSEKLKQTKEASAWLSEQIKELTKGVEAADIAAERFRSSSGLLEGSNNTTLDTQQLSELNSQLILAKAQRTEAEARADLIKKMLKDKGDVDGASDVLNSRLIQRLLEQRGRVQRELAELSVSLLPSHPRIRELNSEIADLRRQIRDEARKVVASLQNEAQIAGARETSLRDSLAELKRSAAKGNESQIKLRALEREAKANRELLESYMARYRDASARSDQSSVPAHASIVSNAHVSNVPSFPKKGPIALLTFAAVALLGLAHTVARELISPRETFRASRRQYAPDNSHGNERRREPHIYNEPQAGVINANSPRNAARQLATANYRRIVITPVSGQGGDAATRTIEMARALAAGGAATILVDATGDGDHVAIALDLSDAPGLHDMLSGEAAFEDTVRRDPDSSLQVISGTMEPGGARQGNSGRIDAVFRALDAAYDHVVIYAGSNEAGALARLPAQGTRALVLLAEAQMSADDALWHADRMLGDAASGATTVVLVDAAGRRATGAHWPIASRTAAV